MQMLSGLSNLGQGNQGMQNPLLYYSYYAQVGISSTCLPYYSNCPPQVLAAMQAQHKLLESPPQTNNNNLSSVKDLLSPLRLGALSGLKQEQVGHSNYQYFKKRA